MYKAADGIVVIDFGSQYNQLIARRVRELKVFSQVLPAHTPLEQILALEPKGIILSGGPASVYEKDMPGCDPRLLQAGIPVLGICYGMQFIAHTLGGAVLRAHKREYGRTELAVDRRCRFLSGVPKRSVCWMSHGDRITRLPRGFVRLAHSAHASIAAFGNEESRIYGVQFHPEVAHTQFGTRMIENFVYGVCRCAPTWTMKSFVREQISAIRRMVGNERVVLGLSGGVDSSVAAVLLHKAIGKRLACIFVDNGLLRKNELQRVREVFSRHFHMNVTYVDASDQFLRRLRGVADPERKRKIIGREFIKVFEREARKLGKVTFLVQGTLYPDVIESVSAFGGPSATIKSHHNVGGLPKRMKLKLLEPLRELFKDEVRKLGEEMRLPKHLVWRQPFPGPGLAVRILGPVSKQRADLLREVDEVVVDEIRRAGLYYSIWQSFAVLLPIKSVGVMGDARTYENCIAVRAVNSKDGMTADWVKLPYDVLERISNRVINEIAGVNRVVYDISSKPPSTIEWE